MFFPSLSKVFVAFVLCLPLCCCCLSVINKVSSKPTWSGWTCGAVCRPLLVADQTTTTTTTSAVLLTRVTQDHMLGCEKIFLNLFVLLKLKTETVQTLEAGTEHINEKIGQTCSVFI